MLSMEQISITQETATLSNKAFTAAVALWILDLVTRLCRSTSKVPVRLEEEVDPAITLNTHPAIFRHRLVYMTLGIALALGFTLTLAHSRSKRQEVATLSQPSTQAMVKLMDLMVIATDTGK